MKLVPDRKWVVLLIIAVLGFILYSNVLEGEFVSDDYVYIVDNPAVRNISDFKSLWHSFNSRFLTGLTLAFNFSLGGLNVFGYHFFNIIIHIANTFLVYLLVSLIYSLNQKKGYSIKHKNSLAIFAALIFLTHPAQVQAVAFISQRLVLLGTMFYLLTLIFYIKAREENKGVFFNLALLSMVLGIFSKEMIASAPVMLLAMEVYFISSWEEVKQKVWLTLRPFFLAILLLPLIIAQQKQGSYPDLNSQLEAGGFSWNYFLTELNVLRTYLRIFFLPVNLNHDYDYPIVQSIFDGQVLFSLLLFISLLFSSVKLFKKARLVSFCIVWFLITTAVEAMAVSFVHKSVIYDHWLYLPMVGFAVCLPFLVQAAAKDRVGFRGIILTIIIVFSLASYQRNKAWQNEVGFWQDVLRKSPDKFTAHMGMANAYQRQGEVKKATQHYKKVIELNPDFGKAYSNLGVAYYINGDDKLALANLKQALALDKNNPAVYNNLAYFYFTQGDCPNSILFYLKAVALRGEYADAYLYMGQCHHAQRRTLVAKNCYVKAAVLYEKQYVPDKAREARKLMENLGK